MSQLDRAGDHSSMASGTIVVQTNSPREMDARLLALVCSGSFQDLESFLDAQDHQASSAVGGSATWRASGEDGEAFLRESLLDGITVGGDTVLHVVATNGDSEEFLKKAGLVHRKAQNLLCAQNNDGDTPLHCAAREGNFAMVSLLIDLARRGDDTNANRVKALLRTENKIEWTALHEAIKSVLTGHDDMVELLMKKDPQLASFPKDGTSPLYLGHLGGEEFHRGNTL
ncbi:ankyrin-1-like [Triticum urartu]|uniref:ankyrin-1-like n=1 Tax=Triticum urartu TaxID=4572 RepID=UPI002043DFF2|nr:ankyrin-1-like [Triticum urartu]